MWGAIAAVGATLLSSQMQADSAGDAIDAQSQASAAAQAEQRRQYDLNRADLTPWRTTGAQAITRLGQLMGLGANVDPLKIATGPIDYNSPEFEAIQRPILNSYGQQYGGGNFLNVPPDLRNKAYGEAAAAFQASRTPTGTDTQIPGFGDLTKKFTLQDFWDDPVTKASYQFGLDTGTKALGNMAGAKGNRNSGAQLKALERFATDYTGQQAGQSQARFVNDQTNLYNRMAGIAGSGQTAANTTVASGTNAANNIAGMLESGGNARGAAAIARGNIYGGAVQNVGNTIANWFNNRNYGGNSANYNAAGTFQPYYTGYGMAGDYQYG